MSIHPDHLGLGTTEVISEGTINPWVGIFLKPRHVMQQILASENPDKWVLFIVAIGGVWESWDRASHSSMGDLNSLNIILLLGLVLGPLGGILGWFIGGWLINKTSSWLDGKGTSHSTRIALAWGSVPMMYVGFLWIPELLYIGGEMFTNEMPRTWDDPARSTAMLVFGVVEITIAIWSIFTIFHCVGEAQGFSAWKALGAFILAAIVAFAVVMIVVIALAFTFGGI